MYLWNNALVEHNRQLNLNHIPKSWKIIFNESVLKDAEHLRSIWKYKNQSCVVFSSKLNTDSFIRIIILFVIIYVCLFLQIYLFAWNWLIGNGRVTLIPASSSSTSMPCSACAAFSSILAFKSCCERKNRTWCAFSPCNFSNSASSSATYSNNV